MGWVSRGPSTIASSGWDSGVWSGAAVATVDVGGLVMQRHPMESCQTMLPVGSCADARARSHVAEPVRHMRAQLRSRHLAAPTPSPPSSPGLSRKTDRESSHLDNCRRGLTDRESPREMDMDDPETVAELARCSTRCLQSRV